MPLKICKHLSEWSDPWLHHRILFEPTTTESRWFNQISILTRRKMKHFYDLSIIERKTLRISLESARFYPCPFALHFSIQKWNPLRFLIFLSDAIPKTYITIHPSQNQCQSFDVEVCMCRCWTSIILLVDCTQFVDSWCIFRRHSIKQMTLVVDVIIYIYFFMTATVWRLYFCMTKVCTVDFVSNEAEREIDFFSN